MALISTKVHGVLDYTTGATLLALPRILGLSDTVRTLLTAAALGTAVYSVVTRYELGLIKLLPMKAHLVMDAMSGLAFCGAPLLLPDEDDETKALLVGIGVFELAVTALTTKDD
jgi:hypothetical protein